MKRHLALVLGSAAINADGDSVFGSISCAAPGVCEAGGWYENSADQVSGFVISES